MAHDGTGDGWSETSPTDSESLSDAAKEMRDLRKGVRKRVEKEHVEPDANGVGGEHLQGSAKAYAQTTQPTDRPDGTTLNADDEGRLLLNTASATLWWFNGTSWSRVMSSNGSFDDNTLTRQKAESGFIGYACAMDRKSSGTAGGTFTQDAWQTRDVNDERADNDSFMSIAANQITLQPGSYSFRIAATAYGVGANQARLRNITDGDTIDYGTTVVSNTTNPSTTQSIVSGYFSISGVTVFEVQHRCATTRNSDGYGPAGTWGNDQGYMIAEFWRLDKP